MVLCAFQIFGGRRINDSCAHAEDFCCDFTLSLLQFQLFVIRLSCFVQTFSQIVTLKHEHCVAIPLLIFVITVLTPWMEQYSLAPAFNKSSACSKFDPESEINSLCELMLSQFNMVQNQFAYLDNKGDDIKDYLPNSTIKSTPSTTKLMVSNANSTTKLMALIANSMKFLVLSMPRIPLRFSTTSTPLLLSTTRIILTLPCVMHSLVLGRT